MRIPSTKRVCLIGSEQAQCIPGTEDAKAVSGTPSFALNLIIILLSKWSQIPSLNHVHPSHLASQSALCTHRGWEILLTTTTGGGKGGSV
jgi:hypothetical protein